MNWDHIEGKWTRFTGSARECWGKITADDILTMNGRKDNLVGRIQGRFGIARAEAERQADEWSQALEEGRLEGAASL
jgi:uncharacterized protein YjbJ (UPF0337 family)